MSNSNKIDIDTLVRILSEIDSRYRWITRSCGEEDCQCDFHAAREEEYTAAWLKYDPEYLNRPEGYVHGDPMDDDWPECENWQCDPFYGCSKCL